MLTAKEWTKLKKWANAYAAYYERGARTDFTSWDWADDEHLAGIGEDMTRVILKAAKRERRR